MLANRLLLRTIPFSLSLIVAGALCGCTKPRQTTAVGSGVGGVLGASLGAIVGNQTGNAGSGLAVGAGAGAAVGALVGNALQAQEERNQRQDESIKRQERVIQAQRNEINELRSIRGDDSYSLGSPAPTTYNSLPSTARYRYRGTSTNPESPEVARQRAKLQQRGPHPRHANRGVDTSNYRSTILNSTWRDTPTRAQRELQSSRQKSTALPATTLSATTARIPTQSSTTRPKAILPSNTSTTHESLARYDVRSELSKSTTESWVKPSNVSPNAPSTETEKTNTIKRELPSSNISESDLTVENNASPKSTARITAPVQPETKLQPESKECKEALEERDLAADATDNSDKLFHLRRALRLCPQSAPLHHELGKVYASMQRTRDAEDEFKEALSLDPNFSAAKRELSSLLKEEIQF